MKPFSFAILEPTKVIKTFNRSRDLKLVLNGPFDSLHSVMICFAPFSDCFSLNNGFFQEPARVGDVIEKAKDEAKNVS